jgi:hypothetical protein
MVRRAGVAVRDFKGMGRLVRRQTCEQTTTNVSPSSPVESRGPFRVRAYVVLYPW